MFCFGKFLLFPRSSFFFLDASANGCAAFIQGTDLVFQRNWSLGDSEKSSTWRELEAIKFSIEAFNTRLSNEGFVGILIVRTLCR